jgi:hypothetical protein
MNTFEELVQARKEARVAVEKSEEQLKTRWGHLLQSKQPWALALQLLSGSFSKVQAHPAVVAVQGALLFYRDYKDNKVPTKDAILEYLLDLASRVIQRWYPSADSKSTQP